MASSDDPFERLTRLDDLERSAQNGTLHTWLPELEAASSALGSDPRASVLRALRRALRIDLAFLVEHPGETFACLYNRLVWHGAPQTGVYYDLPAREAAPSVCETPPGASADPLQVILNAWRRAREAHGDPWLRSLRPPEIALDGGLLEEYRAGVPEASLRLRTVDGGRRIELTYGPWHHEPESELFAQAVHTCITWDRTTGRRQEDARVQLYPRTATLDGTLALKHESGEDAELVERESGQKLSCLACSDLHRTVSVAYSAGAVCVALAGYNGQEHGFVVVCDVQTGAPVARLRVDVPLFQVALSPRADRVAASGTQATYIWDVATRQQIRTLPLGGEALAFLSRERLVVCDALGVVRVWDLECESAFLRGHRAGITNAAFSPDGARLVTGSRLSAATTGELIADLDFKRPEYFLVGPPRNAFAIGDTRLVFLERRVEVWETRTGTKVVDARDRFYDYYDVLALHPDGTRYAWSHEERKGDVPVAIIATDTGATLVAFTTEAVTCMAWAPDGQTLATASVDGTVRLWRGDGRLLRTLAGLEFRINDLAFFRGGTHLLAAAGPDGLHVWRVDPAELVCSRPLADELGAIWILSDDVIGAVSHYLGDQHHALPWTLEARGIGLALVDRSTGKPIAWFPGSDKTIRHPSEPIWAGGVVHLRLEGWGSARGLSLMQADSRNAPAHDSERARQMSTDIAR